MQAVWLTRFGAPEVLVARPTPDPVAADGQVVVDVEAVSITFVETLVRAGRAPWGSAPEPPNVPGNGVGGVVSAVGPGVDPQWLGQRVVTGTGGTGGYAERVAVAARLARPRARTGSACSKRPRCWPMVAPRSGSSQLAAITRGDRVLVEAAAGGVGSLLVQLAVNAGAQVIAAAGGAAKGERAIGLGATYAVDYDRPEWADDVSVDIGVSTSCSTGSAAASAPRPSGSSDRAVGLCRSGWPAGSPTDTAAAGDRGVTVIGFRELSGIGARSAELTAAALDLAVRGLLKPLIGQTFPLAEAARAHAAIESRATIGKTLLLP